MSLPMLSSNITLHGGGFTIDANNTGRVFCAESGTVTIPNVTIANAVARGGAGGNGGRRDAPPVAPMADGGGGRWRCRRRGG
jgi:hypothetical protein